jgi:hypothetical protein
MTQTFLADLSPHKWQPGEHPHEKRKFIKHNDPAMWTVAASVHRRVASGASINLS